MTTRPYHPASYGLEGLIMLSNEIEHHLSRMLGLNLTDYRALSALTASGPVTVGALARRLNATPATTTAIVNRLESRGYATRRRGDDDRRRVEVSVTRQGSQRIMSLMGPLMDATNELIWSLPAEHQRVIEDFFDQANQQMRDHLAALSSMEEAL